MSKIPVAYIRKSRVLNNHGVSWEVQEAAVRALSGDPALVVLSDWNRSGRHTGRRPGYQKMLEMIEAGMVSAVYAYSLSRFARSVKDFSAFAEFCIAHGVAVRFAAESSLNIETNGQSATNTLLLNVMMSFAQFEADVASERSKEGVAVRRARGDRIGHPFYGEREGEDAADVVTAFKDAGSIMGAARLLNVRGVPTRMGGPWSSVSVRETLVRLGAYPNRTRPGAKARAPFLFYGLLRCHCGHLLTGSRFQNGSDPTYTSYKCHLARSVPDHGPGSIPEKRMLAWAKAEYARLRPPESIEVEAVNRQAERTALAARRARIQDMYDLGDILRDEYQRRLTVVSEAEDRLADQEAAATVVRIPVVDWDRHPPTKINAVIRALWSEIILDETMTPVRAEWIVPEWRNPSLRSM